VTGFVVYAKEEGSQKTGSPPHLTPSHQKTSMFGSQAAFESVYIAELGFLRNFGAIKSDKMLRISKNSDR
jgi:hypothetical protein